MNLSKITETIHLKEVVRLKCKVEGTNIKIKHGNQQKYLIKITQ